jgi:hypothetical protein
MQSPARLAALALLLSLPSIALAVPSASPSTSEQVTSRQGTIANGLLALARGQFFTRADGGSCTH